MLLGRLQVAHGWRLSLGAESWRQRAGGWRLEAGAESLEPRAWTLEPGAFPGGRGEGGAVILFWMAGFWTHQVSSLVVFRVPGASLGSRFLGFWRLEDAGGRRLGLEPGNWWLEVRGWRLEAGGWRLEAGGNS